MSCVKVKSGLRKHRVHQRRLPFSKRKFDAIQDEGEDDDSKRKQAGPMSKGVLVTGFDSDDVSTRQVDMQNIGDKLSIPVEAQGTGWQGFDLHITDSALPCKLIEIPSQASGLRDSFGDMTDG